MPGKLYTSISRIVFQAIYCFIAFLFFQQIVEESVEVFIQSLH